MNEHVVAFARRAGDAWAVAVAPLVFLCPPVLGYSVLLGADAWFAALIVCGFGFAARCARTGGRSRTASCAAAVACAVLAQAARPTAAPAVLALLCAVALVMLPSGLLGWRRALTVAALGPVGAVLVLGSVLGTERYVIHAEAVHPEQQTLEYDLISMSIRERRMLLPPDIYPRQDLAYLEKLWSPVGFHLLLWGGFAAIPPKVEGAQLDSLRSAWVAAIRQHPIDYLRARQDNAVWQLTIKNDANFVNQTPGQPAGSGYRQAFPALHDRLADYLTIGATRDRDGDLVGGPLHRVWAYLLVLALGVIAGFGSRRRTGAILGLLSMALLMYSALVVLFSPLATFRYMYPTVATATVVAVAMIVAAAGWLGRRLISEGSSVLTSGDLVGQMELRPSDAAAGRRAR